MVTPLVKAKPGGLQYVRRAHIEALLKELEALPPAALVTRCEISRRSAPDYVPSECVLYFVRRGRNETGAGQRKLVEILMKRVLSSLSRGESRSGGQDLDSEEIREAAFGKFMEMITMDRAMYCERLDFFEINFENPLKNLWIDAGRTVFRRRECTFPLEADADTNELSLAVERAAGSFDISDVFGLEAEDCRSRLPAAIESLPTEEKRIVVMIMQGYPIDSQDPDVETISRTLGKSERTIRTYRDRAFATLRTVLGDAR